MPGSNNRRIRKGTPRARANPIVSPSQVAIPSAADQAVTQDIREGVSARNKLRRHKSFKKLKVEREVEI